MARTKKSSTKTFKGGGTRSSIGRFDFVSLHPIALIALAETAGEGSEKYGPNNYERGMPVLDILNHVFRHLLLYLAGDRSEPHLAHAMWGLHAAIVSDLIWPDRNEGRMRGPGCTLPKSMLRRMRAEDPMYRKRRASGKLGANWKLEDQPEIRQILGSRKKPIG